MQRVLFVRGSKAPPWESSVLREFQGFGYDAKFVVPAKYTSVDNDLQIFGTDLKSKSFIEKMLNKSRVARFLNYGLNIKTDEFISRYFNPRKLFKELDILHPTGLWDISSPIHSQASGCEVVPCRIPRSQSDLFSSGISYAL